MSEQSDALIPSSSSALLPLMLQLRGYRGASLTAALRSGTLRCCAPSDEPQRARGLCAGGGREGDHSGCEGFTGRHAKSAADSLSGSPRRGLASNEAA